MERENVFSSFYLKFKISKKNQIFLILGKKISEIRKIFSFLTHVLECSFEKRKKKNLFFFTHLNKLLRNGNGESIPWKGIGQWILSVSTVVRFVILTVISECLDYFFSSKSVQQATKGRVRHFKELRKTSWLTFFYYSAWLS